MKAIGFKNFRRFENFPTMELGDITMLVGGNNSGKSTMVKAALLVKSFINSKNIDIFGDDSSRPMFRFDVRHTQIGSFKNALFAGSNDNHIVFEYEDSGAKYKIVVSGEREQQDKTITYGFVDFFSMEVLGAKYELDFLLGRMSVSFPQDLKSGKNKTEIREDVDYLNNVIAELKEKLSKETDFEQILKYKSKIKLCEDFIKDDVNSPILIELPIQHNIGRPFFDFFIYNILDAFEKYGAEPMPYDIAKGCAEYMRISTEKKAIQERSQYFFNARANLTKSLEHSVEYIHAHNVSQEVFFKSTDKSDIMAQILHNYMVLRIQPEDPEHKLVQEWMRKFDIGDNFEIISYDGGAYSINVIDSNRLSMPLGSKGTGSIQVMTLLLQLAGFIKKYKAVRFDKPTILIEEPEQNLHPRLQSLLADLFLAVSKQYGFSFLIETHSEYMIRKTQVLWAEMVRDNESQALNNPFSVFYFPKTGVPYNMGYQNNGRFEKKFGPGFFDVASEYSIQLNKLGRINN